MSGRPPGLPPLGGPGSEAQRQARLNREKRAETYSRLRNKSMVNLARKPVNRQVVLEARAKVGTTATPPPPSMPSATNEKAAYNQAIERARRTAEQWYTAKSSNNRSLTKTIRNTCGSLFGACARRLRGTARGGSKKNRTRRRRHKK